VKAAVAIKSCHKYADRRAVQLATWIPQLDTDFFFIIGGPAPVGTDFLYCNALSDSFTDLAPKVLCAVEYALESNVTNLCVLDDDTYVVPPRLMKCGFHHFDYLGFVRNYGMTPYMQGSCYWLSERAMERILKHRDYMTTGVPDDVAVGRCLYGEVPFTHEHRFAVGEPYPEPDRWPHADNETVSCHKVSPQRMLCVHAGVTAGGK